MWGGKLLTINLDDLLLCKSDESMWLQEEEFVTALKPDNAKETIRAPEGSKQVPKVVENCEIITLSTAPNKQLQEPVATADNSVGEFHEASETESMAVQDYNGEATEDIIDKSFETEVRRPQDDTETNEESSHNVPPPPKPKSSTYRVTCNTCNKILSSCSITVHNILGNLGLYGPFLRLYLPFQANIPLVDSICISSHISWDMFRVPSAKILDP